MVAPNLPLTRTPARLPVQAALTSAGDSLADRWGINSTRWFRQAPYRNYRIGDFERKLTSETEFHIRLDMLHKLAAMLGRRSDCPYFGFLLALQ